MKRPSFVLFCKRTLKLTLTNAQRVLVAVAIDGVQPKDLAGNDREIARELFGEVDEVPEWMRRVLVWSLGRGSGKTLLAGALLVYAALTSDLARVGPGMIPAAVAIAPRLSTAKIIVNVARELVRAAPDLEKLVADDDDSKEGFTLVRERRVRIAGLAASRGGINVRGFDLLALVLEEAELFYSESDAAVTDRDSYNGAIPRLLHGPTHFAVFIGTPWPTPTLMGELYDHNFGNPQTAFAAKGSTLRMRDNDPQLAREIDDELALDPENTRRERFCDRDAMGATTFFDHYAIMRAVDDSLVLPATNIALARTGFGADLGFRLNSSVACVVQEDPWGRACMRALDEQIPRRGAPLVPSEVVAKMVDVFKPFVAIDHSDAAGRKKKRATVYLDQHYLESAREHFTPHGFDIATLNENTETYGVARDLLHDSKRTMIVLPRNARLLSQLRAVVSKPLPGGKTKIELPRRGASHGDLVAGWVAALYGWSLAPSQSDATAAPTRAWPGPGFGSLANFDDTTTIDL